MLSNTYIQDCRQLLQAFEDTQEKLILLNVPEATAELRIEFRQLNEYFSAMHKDLNHRFSGDKPLIFLNLRQLDRLQQFLKELKTQINQLNRMKKPDYSMIIFFLQRQYKFKQIFRRHLTDYARLTW